MVNTGLPNRSLQVRAREIAPADIDAVTGLLGRGFRSRRSRGFWRKVFAGLESRRAVDGFPRYGYLLEAGDRPVGVILTIFAKPGTGPDRDAVRCNLSSWYVEPAYRSYAPLLAVRALRYRDATYLNISPAPNTRPIVEAQGYTRYSNGLFIAVPALQRRTAAAKAMLLEAGADPDVPFEPHEREILRVHAAFGCLSFWCATPERAYPFVFRRRFAKGVIPFAHLVYCGNPADVARFAGLIGRHLIRHGCPVVAIDANGPIAGLTGLYLDGMMPKYFKGPQRPRLGDLAYTEAALFGM